MSSFISSTVKNLWKKMTNKEYRDSYVSAHISNTIASQIFSLRDRRGWTQKDLAKQSGMSQSRISALEDPNYENIEVGTLKRLASAFDVGLTVRFIPFSELTQWTAELTTEKIEVADFEHDRLGDAVPAATEGETILIMASRPAAGKLRHKIAQAHAHAQALFNAATEHLVKELAEIEGRKPPPPITLPDGRTFVYTGPLPK